MDRLPTEIKDDIRNIVVKLPGARVSQQPSPEPTAYDSRIEYRPPTDGTCMLMTIPAETRRQIFAESLPDRDKIHHPQCGNIHKVSGKDKCAGESHTPHLETQADSFTSLF